MDNELLGINETKETMIYNHAKGFYESYDEWLIRAKKLLEEYPLEAILVALLRNLPKDKRYLIDRFKGDLESELAK